MMSRGVLIFRVYIATAIESHKWRAKTLFRLHNAHMNLDFLPSTTHIP